MAGSLFLGDPTEAASQAIAGWTKYGGNPVYGGNYGTCFDVAVLKVIPLNERKSLQVRAEAFDVFNQAQFFGATSVNGTFGSPQFGRIVSAMPAGIMQMGIKFFF